VVTEAALPPFDAWVLSLRSANPEGLLALRSEVADRLRAAASALSTSPTLAAIQDGSKHLVVLQEFIAARSREIPSEASLIEDEGEARAAVAEIAPLVGGDITGVVLARPQPEMVLEAARKRPS
jgi:hypothetical protein